MTKRIKLNLLFKLSYLNSNFTLTLGYLNPALSNPALVPRKKFKLGLSQILSKGFLSKNMQLQQVKLKPGHHMIVPIVPVIKKNFKMIWATGSFHIIVSTASKTRDAGSSAISLGETIEFLRMLCKQAKHNKGFCLAICFSSRFCSVTKLEEFHKDIVSQ